MKVHNNRKFIVKGIFIFITLVFLSKLFYIQVVNDKYKFSAKNNVLRYDVKYPGRGLLYDRNNQLLAYNEASYDLMIVPREVEKNIDSTFAIVGPDARKYHTCEVTINSYANLQYKSSNTQPELEIFTSKHPWHAMDARLAVRGDDNLLEEDFG